MSLREILESGMRYTRPQLCNMTKMGDRAVRNEIKKLRRAGMPIKADKNEGGYKLATTPAEKQELIDELYGYALDILKTIKMLCKAMQLDGQIVFDELMKDVKGEEDES